MEFIQTCLVETCDSQSLTKGYCSSHYARLRRHGDPLKGTPKRNQIPIPCTVIGCVRHAIAKKVCGLHYRRIQVHGKPGPAGRINKQHVIGERVSASGYVMVPDPNSHLRKRGPKGHRRSEIGEHRLVMESYLGRMLLPTENVHHKNGNKQDNRLENLELWSINQPSGQRIEDKLKWARELIALYGPEEQKLRDIGS
jgi:hypothetical protein